MHTTPATLSHTTRERMARVTEMLSQLNETARRAPLSAENGEHADQLKAELDGLIRRALNAGVAEDAASHALGTSPATLRHHIRAGGLLYPHLHTAPCDWCTVRTAHRH